MEVTNKEIKNLLEGGEDLVRYLEDYTDGDHKMAFAIVCFTVSSFITTSAQTMQEVEEMVGHLTNSIKNHFMIKNIQDKEVA